MDSIRSAVCWALTLVFYFVGSNLQANAEPRWPLPEGIKSAEVNGYDMAYQEAGSGPHIVLVHGALTDSGMHSFQHLPSAFMLSRLACVTTIPKSGMAPATTLPLSNMPMTLRR
jgi:hypothetical protein